MNETQTVQITHDESGDLILPLPKAVMEKMQWLVGDMLDFEPIGREGFSVKNLSVKTMYASRMRRNLNSIIRKINSETDPLNRVLIKRKCRKTSTFCAILVKPELPIILGDEKV